jgi:hypothetical protein
MNRPPQRPSHIVTSNPAVASGMTNSSKRRNRATSLSAVGVNPS